MKATHKQAAFLLLLCAMALLPRYAAAANLNIGGSVWYAWWDMSLKDSLRGAPVPHYSLYNRYRMKPSFLYGPVLSADFAKQFGISASFMYTDLYRAYTRSASTLSPEMLDRSVNEITKYDLDTTASYSPVRYVKLFTGFKFQGYDLTGRAHVMDLDGTGYGKNFSSAKARAYGAGLGLGITVPIVGGLYFQWNISGLYLHMALDHRGEVYKIEMLPAPPNLFLPGVVELKFRFHSYGGNTNAGFAYVIQKISSTIILGFRYQVIYNTLYDLDLKSYIANLPADILLSLQVRDRYFQRRSVNRKYDHFYGLTFAFVYSIELTRDE